MRALRFLLPLLVIGILAFAPAAYAADANFFGPLINEECKCVGSAPDWGCVLQTLQNVINLGVSLGVIFFVLVTAYAGALFMASSVNPGGRKQARTMMGAAAVGLIVALSAWLLVDFVMKAIYNEGSFGPWNSILDENSTRTCIVTHASPEGPSSGGPTSPSSGFSVGDQVECQNADGNYVIHPLTVTAIREENGEQILTVDPGEEDVEEAISGEIQASRCRPFGEEEPGEEVPGGTMTHSCTGTAGSGPESGTPKQDLSCENCRSLNGVTIKSGANDNLYSGTASKVEDISFSSGWEITEAFPPTSCIHRNSCHYTGTCADAAFSDRDYTDVDRIVSFMQAGESAGLRVYFETSNCALRTQVRAAGMSRAYCSGDPGYGAITGNHFSLYGP